MTSGCRSNLLAGLCVPCAERAVARGKRDKTTVGGYRRSIDRATRMWLNAKACDRELARETPGEGLKDERVSRREGEGRYVDVGRAKLDGFVRGFDEGEGVEKKARKVG